MWKTVKLGDVCDLQNGFAFKSSDYVDNSNTLNIRMSNIRPNGKFNEFHNIKYLPDDYANKYANYKLIEGDLIIAMTDMAGDPKILGMPTIIKNLDGRIFLLNQRVGKLHSFSDEIYVPYLCYFLSTLKNFFKTKGAGGLQINISKKDILSAEIPLPPLPEQERIVAKLDTAFAEIDGAIEKAQAKEKEIQKLKASLLNISLSSDAVASETLKLGDLCDVITKGTTPTSVGFKFESDGINFIKVESLTSNNGFIPGKFAKISTDCNESLKRSQLQKGDILFSIAGALGRTAVVTEDILPANTNQALAIIRLKSNIEIDTRFLLYLLNSDTTREQSERNKGGVAQQNLSLTQLKNYDVYLPSFTEQQQIVARLDAAFNELENANGAIKKSKLNYSSLKAAILTKELQSSEAA